MKTQWHLLKSMQPLVIAAVLALGGLGSARAAENHTGAWGLISTMGSQNPYDAIWLVTGDPANPSVHNNLIYVNMDMQYNYPSYEEWETATWRPASSFPTQRFAASLLGTDSYTQPIEGRYIQLRNLTLERADLDAQNVEFRFSPIPPVPGTTTSLTLKNGSLTALNPPGFNVNANLTLTTSGDSTLSGWGKGPVSSQTLLNVTPGSQLTFFRLGNYAHGTVATDSWYFSHPGDVATIDGGTLKLDQSFVTFGKPVVAAGEELGKMTFQNNALLDIVGEGGRLDSGNFFFLDSRLNLGSANRLRAANTVTLNGATLTTDENSKLVTEALDIYGNNSITLGKETRSGDYIVTTGAMVVRPDALLTLNSQDGQGSLAVTFELSYDPAGSGHQQGQIVINDNATLVNAGALFDIPPSAPITTNRTSDALFGMLYVTDGGSLNLRASTADPGHVANHGQIGVDTDGVLAALGPSIIQGGSEGRIDIGDAGVLMLGNTGTPSAADVSLTTDNTVYLESFSTLDLTLDPTARKNGQLRAGSTLYIEPFAELHLALVDDVSLSIGTKFRLINYASLDNAPPNHGTFNGLPDGHIFGLGSNAYRIDYADTPDTGYTNAITLTVVGVPALSPAVQQVSGPVNTLLTTQSLTAINFGCTVGYTSTALPSGLSLDASTGVISGTPTASQPAANVTITGACDGYTATATVTITVAATQTITFGPAPTPNFTPNGTFDVSATATSGGVVAYSSLTPLVCATNGGPTIVMLGAGLCTIAANQPGNASYAPAPQVTQGISIPLGTQTALVLSASPASVAVNGTSLLRTTGGSGTGTVTYRHISGPCSLSGATLTGTGTGSCVFNATKAADANYTARTSNDLTLVVTALPLTGSYPASPLTIDAPAYLPPTVSGATGPLIYSLVSGPLPTGMTLDPVTGVISGIPTGPAGVFTVAIKVTDGTAVFIASLTLTVQSQSQAIPTLSEWGMLILVGLMVLAAGWRDRKVRVQR
jgi:hypothetical protein